MKDCESKLKKLKSERDSFKNAWKNEVQWANALNSNYAALQDASCQLTEQAEKAEKSDKGFWKFVSIVLVLTCITEALIIFNGFVPMENKEGPVQNQVVATTTITGAGKHFSEKLNECQSSWRAQRTDIANNNETIRLLQAQLDECNMRTR